MTSIAAENRIYANNSLTIGKNPLGKPLVSVAVEPTNSPVIRQSLNGEVVQPGPHKIQGIGAYFVPANLDLLEPPDSGERYLSSVLFKGVFNDKGLAAV